MSTTSSSSRMATDVRGKSGRKYKIERALQDKGFRWGCVYLATTDGARKVVLKEIPQDWDARIEVYQMTSRCSNIRVPIDSIPEMRILVFDYIDEHLLSLLQKKVPLEEIKRALKWTLEGISQLHTLNIAHNDIKPNNILVQTARSKAGIKVERVLITDLEDAVHLEPGRVLQGAPLGNYMWRSPEAHAGGPMEMASDMFAFGIVCIYALTKTVIFAVENPDLAEDDKVGTVLFRQMSYLGDNESGIRGLLEYLGEENEMRELFEAIDEACRDVPKNPFTAWEVPGLDDDFKDLVKGLTRLDPRRRIAAKEALRHPWFAEVS